MGHKKKKILVANRGEIAVRVLNAAKELNYHTLAVYSEVDKKSLHIRCADECHFLENRGIEPYLDIDQIVNLAIEQKVDAIHPGYGFLSENASFAQAAENQDLVFVGPGSDVITKMGDKLSAKALAKEAGVPVIPGFEAQNSLSYTEISHEVEKIGFPVLIKARAGGGGKGMRLIHDSSELESGLKSARNEARDAFGDDRIFIEKYIQKPKHIEVQVLADAFGNSLHLNERDCSVQRRHQKVIEEAPSAVLDEATRKNICRSALDLVSACNYVNAGTIEFVLDQYKNYYFLEMNTRLQVEHPVTEYITGVDLVKEQFRIAFGGQLEISQSDIGIGGHAIELRVYAEDPQNSFMPDIGKLEIYRPPSGMGVRVDSGYEEGMEIPLEYDPLIAKLVVYGNDRDEAIARMKRAIEDFQIEGVSNTLQFGHKVMEEGTFIDGSFDTNLVESKKREIIESHDDLLDSKLAVLVANHFYESRKQTSKHSNDAKSSSWRDRRHIN